MRRVPARFDRTVASLYLDCEWETDSDLLGGVEWVDESPPLLNK